MLIAGVGVGCGTEVALGWRSVGSQLQVGSGRVGRAVGTASSGVGRPLVHALKSKSKPKSIDGILRIVADSFEGGIRGLLPADALYRFLSVRFKRNGKLFGSE